jgi:catechol 2,3-dioxygenase-like lactoylglutathione lyase family enzyme
MSIKGLDHVAIPIENVDAMLTFYRQLGFAVEPFVDGRLPFYAVHFGEHRFNFHDPKTWQAESFSLRAPNAVPGSGDFCFVWDGTLEALLAFVEDLRVDVELGPVEMTGGRQGGKLKGQSVYLRDPDRNLLEFIVYP